MPRGTLQSELVFGAAQHRRNTLLSLSCSSDIITGLAGAGSGGLQRTAARMEDQKSQLSEWQTCNEDDRSPTVDLRAPESVSGLQVELTVPVSDNAGEFAAIK